MEKPLLIASDVDGTLLDVTETITARTKDVLDRVVASGTPFLLVSGRPPRWIRPIAEMADVNGLSVCANGAVLYDIGKDTVVSAETLDPALSRNIADTVKELLPGSVVAVERHPHNGIDETFVCEPDYASPWGDTKIPVRSLAEAVGQPAVKILIRHRNMTSDEMARTVVPVLRDHATITYSTNQGLLEFSKKDVTKATGLAKAAEMFGIGRADIVAFGDMPNDIPMLEWAGHGVAMSNAHPDALAVADEVTAANSEDGVAQVLERWF
ncbi:Cof-type HAD-IIB family hydrolase [Kibdelosporangium philippinense]|uniref:Cof-type HAD-IIB family hydrolase n=1 Tax=Kibdelosporangium philippinense TaxID=211113 RepID=A0ABS8ZAI0_9PSEU|nr:Cof-type HAD-IIB family hydrolase [Kibdelosporangium philippinense]